jgi:triacylglycerol esterase/lipase EstA (alpha/beta hydrolase family)
VVTALTLLVVFFGAVAAYVVFAVGMAAHGIAAGWLVAGALAIYVAIYLGAAGFSFALAWIFRTPRPPECSIGARATLRLYVGEMVAMAKSHPRMAFGWWAMRDPPPRPAVNPVLLLHGVLCNAGVWRGVLPQFAAAADSPIYTLSYGPPQASIEYFVHQLAAKIDAIRAATGAAKVTLVTHSMGGLVARAYLLRYGSEHVRCLIGIGTPHHGSVHAWIFPGTCLAQIRPRSRWLAELNRNESAGPPVRVVSIWSWHDSMVAPQASACLEGAENVAVVGVGHNALIDNAEVVARVATELGRADRGANA